MKKVIALDVRMYGLGHAGIGRYVVNLLDELSKLSDFNRFRWVLFCQQKDLPVLKKKYSNRFRYIKANFPHYSLAEQIFFPLIAYRAGCDLIHFPHFNLPLFYRKKFVVTIHDLIKHHSRGPQTTTRNQFIYYLKFFGYQLIVKHAAQKAKRVFVPSRFVKKQIANQYQTNSDKIIVTYEGVNSHFQFPNLQILKKDKINILKKHQIKKPYLLYVGSVYPHKNIDRLIEAVKAVQQEIPQISLVIVCSRNVFWEKLRKKINFVKAEKFIKLTGFVPDQDLVVLYQEATSFVFPSLSEGFGLPPLEAMASGCPVVSSNATCLPEIYGKAVLFFNPLETKDMAEKIIKMTKNKELQDQYRNRGFEKVKEYSWKKMAKRTLEEYQKAIG